LLIIGLSLQAQVNLDSGLVGCYPFSGNANDQSGHGNNGVVYGATLTTDRFGTPNSAYNFTGSNSDHIAIPNFPSMITKNEFSISIWTQSSINTSSCPIVLIADSAKNRLCACVQYTSGPYCIWDYGDFLTTGRMVLATGPYTKAWQHYVFMISQSENIKKIYENGILIDSSACTGSITTTSRVLSIGGSLDWSGGPLWWYGALDDVRIYDRAITANEVMMLYKSSPPCIEGPVCAISGKVSACSYCSGSAYVTFSDTGTNYTFQWSNGDTGSSVTNLCPGKYYVNVLHNGIWVATDSTTIVPLPGPAITINASLTNIKKGDSAVLTAMASGGVVPYTYTWNGKDTGQTIQVSPSVSTIYTVAVTDSSGCISTAEIIVHVECGQLFIPDVFSPNGDGQNDVLYVRGDCINTIMFDVFDRWGNKVFTTNNINMGWNGMYNGQAMNTGTYVYYIYAVMMDGSKIERSGNITLVR